MNKIQLPNEIYKIIFENTVKNIIYLEEFLFVLSISNYARECIFHFLNKNQHEIKYRKLKLLYLEYRKEDFICIINLRLHIEYIGTYRTPFFKKKGIILNYIRDKLDISFLPICKKNIDFFFIELIKVENEIYDEKENIYEQLLKIIERLYHDIITKKIDETNIEKLEYCILYVYHVINTYKYVKDMEKLDVVFSIGNHFWMLYETEYCEKKLMCIYKDYINEIKCKKTLEDMKERICIVSELYDYIEKRMIENEISVSF